MLRETCFLDNKEFTQKMLELQEALSQDFLKNKLQACAVCSKKLDADIRHDLHQKLIGLYNDLSDIKRKLTEINK